MRALAVAALALRLPVGAHYTASARYGSTSCASRVRKARRRRGGGPVMSSSRTCCGGEQTRALVRSGFPAATLQTRALAGWPLVNEVERTVEWDIVVGMTRGAVVPRASALRTTRSKTSVRSRRLRARRPPPSNRTRRLTPRVEAAGTTTISLSMSRHCRSVTWTSSNVGARRASPGRPRGQQPADSDRQWSVTLVTRILGGREPALRAALTDVQS